MKERHFGRTGLSCSEIGHGTWSMGFMWGPRRDDEAVASLIRSMELGVNFIDTAYAYGEGHSERLIAKAFQQVQRRVIVATKIPPKNMHWPARHTVPVDQVFPGEWIIQMTEASLKNLGTDCLDIQQFHVWSDSWIDKGDWLEAVTKLKRSGKIRWFGVSINDHEPDSAVKAVASGIIDSVQVIYNIFDQAPEHSLLPLCLKLGVAVIVRVPFDEGSLTGQLSPTTTFDKDDWRRSYFTQERLPETCQRVDAIRPLVQKAGAKNIAELALRFCLADPAVSVVIPGMRKIQHVEDVARVSDGRPLTPGLLANLKRHAWSRNFYPK